MTNWAKFLQDFYFKHTINTPSEGIGLWQLKYQKYTMPLNTGFVLGNLPWYALCIPHLIITDLEILSKPNVVTTDNANESLEIVTKIPPVVLFQCSIETTIAFQGSDFGYSWLWLLADTRVTMKNIHWQRSGRSQKPLTRTESKSSVEL